MFGDKIPRAIPSLQTGPRGKQCIHHLQPSSLQKPGISPSRPVCLLTRRTRPLERRARDPANQGCSEPGQATPGSSRARSAARSLLGTAKGAGKRAGALSATVRDVTCVVVCVWCPRRGVCLVRLRVPLIRWLLRVEASDLGGVLSLRLHLAKLT